jgi:hypothetical protein
MALCGGTALTAHTCYDEIIRMRQSIGGLRQQIYPAAETVPVRVLLTPAKPTQEQERDRMWNLLVLAARGS